MASTVTSLMTAAGLTPGGVVCWGDPIPNTKPGVYAVSMDVDPNTVGMTLPLAPISLSQASSLLQARPSLTIDGATPDAVALAQRVSEFWVPDENVLYIGLAGRSLRDRVSAYYGTRLGRRSPHAGGWFLKLLENLDRLHVHYAESANPKKSEDRMLAAFVSEVSPASKRELRDPGNPFPFANLEWPKGTRKQHGIRSATGGGATGNPSRGFPQPPVARTSPTMGSTPVGRRVSDFLQKELRRREQSEVAAVEAARWLDRAGILKDSADRPGRPLRDLLRGGEIDGQHQEPNNRWFIRRADRR